MSEWVCVGECVCVRERERRERVRVCIFFVFTRAFAYVCICVHMFVYVGWCVCECACAFVRICAFAIRAYVHVCECVHACVHACVHVRAIACGGVCSCGFASTRRRKLYTHCLTTCKHHVGKITSRATGPSSTICRSFSLLAQVCLCRHICMYQYVYSDCKMFVHRPI